MLTSNDIEEIAADLAKETVHPSYRPASESSTGTYEIAGDPVSAATNFSGGKSMSNIYVVCRLLKKLNHSPYFAWPWAIATLHLTIGSWLTLSHHSN